MNKRLKAMIARYAELEMEIHALVSARLSHVCKACGKHCCRPEICREVVESWWLRNVSEHVHGKWWPADWETTERCIAIGESGCILKAGRTGLCRSFVCDNYTEAYGDVWDAIFYSFAADLLMDVGALASGKSIEAMDEKTIRAKAEKIAERIERAHGLLAEARTLIDPAADEARKGRVALKLLASVPRCLRATTQRAILERVGRGRNALG